MFKTGMPVSNHGTNREHTWYPRCTCFSFYFADRRLCQQLKAGQQTQITVFSSPSNFSVCTFAGPFVVAAPRMRAGFQHKPLFVWSNIFPNKKPKQNSSIFKRVTTGAFADDGTAISQRDRVSGASFQELCAEWLVCIACCIIWH